MLIVIVKISSVNYKVFYLTHSLCCTSVVVRHWEEELERKKNGLRPRLLMVLLKCLWWRLILHGLLFSLEVRKYLQ